MRGEMGEEEGKVEVEGIASEWETATEKRKGRWVQLECNK